MHGVLKIWITKHRCTETYLPRSASLCRHTGSLLHSAAGRPWPHLWGPSNHGTGEHSSQSIPCLLSLYSGLMSSGEKTATDRVIAEYMWAKIYFNGYVNLHVPEYSVNIFNILTSVAAVGAVVGLNFRPLSVPFALSPLSFFFVRGGTGVT